jgi:hypothetical protein
MYGMGRNDAWIPDQYTLDVRDCLRVHFLAASLTWYEDIYVADNRPDDARRKVVTFPQMWVVVDDSSPCMKFADKTTSFL